MARKATFLLISDDRLMTGQHEQACECNHG
jgi:hypothetical protein